MKTLAVLINVILLPSVVFAVDAAGEKDLRQLLQQGLFEEEANRDTAKAAAAYEDLITRYNTQRRFAATALFRLAEIRAKEGKNAEAIALHQQLLTEFPSDETLGKLSRERLAALGGAAPTLTTSQETLTDAETKELILLRQIAENSPDLMNAPDQESKFTPLMKAAWNGWITVATFLLDHGADVNKATFASPLMKAAEMGHKRMVELLLKRGADVNFQSYNKLSALSEATTNERLEVVRVLLTHGADPNRVSLIMNSTDSARTTERNRVRPPRAYATKSGAPLHIAVQKSNLPLLTLLLDHKADINIANWDGYSPLMVAIVQKEEAMLRELLTRGANVNAGMTAKGSALHLAAGAEGWPEIVPLLLEHGASVKTIIPVPQLTEGATYSDVVGQTALHSAMNAFKMGDGTLTEPEQTQLLKLWQVLLEKGADINARDVWEKTPLFLAGKRRELPVSTLIWLVEHGADLKVKDKGGGTVLGYIYNSSFAKGLELERRYTFPKLRKENAIMVTGSGYFGLKQSTITIEQTAEAEAAPGLKNVLLKAFENNDPNYPISEFRLLVFRLQKNGEFIQSGEFPMKPSQGPFPADADLPMVQWGDIIVAAPESEEGHPTYPSLSGEKFVKWIQGETLPPPIPKRTRVLNSPPG